MTDINHVVLVGRLTKDLGADQNSFGYLQNGTAFGKFSIAVNKSRKTENNEWVDDANYFDVTIWGKTAENLKTKLTKGTQVVVDGFLKQDRWEKDGQKFSKISIVANSVQIGYSKQQTQEYQDQPFIADNLKNPQQQMFNPVQNPQPQFEQQQMWNNNQNESSDGFPEDIPF